MMHMHVRDGGVRVWVGGLGGIRARACVCVRRARVPCLCVRMLAMWPAAGAIATLPSRAGLRRTCLNGRWLYPPPPSITHTPQPTPPIPPPPPPLACLHSCMRADHPSPPVRTPTLPRAPHYGRRLDLEPEAAAAAVARAATAACPAALLPQCLSRRRRRPIPSTGATLHTLMRLMRPTGSRHAPL